MRVARIARSRQPSVVTGHWVRFPVLGAAVLSATVMVGHATEFPARPLRLVVPYPAGGNGDVVARILAADMAKGLGQHLVVETRPGAGGTIGADVVAKAAPDGHTLLLVTGGHAVAAASYKSLPYQTVDSFSMVSTATFFPFVVVVRADGGYPSLPALLQAAKAAPGIVKFGSAGPGVTQHLTGELLSKMAGARFLYVPYKGDAPAVTALLGSEINLIITPTAPVLPHVQSGRFKLIATTGATRWKGMPEVPTVAESGVSGFDVSSWIGLATTAGTPRSAVGRLHAEMQRTLQTAEVSGRLEQIGGEPRGSTPDEMRNRVAAEVQRWTQVINDAGIQLQ
ncbi:MAG TPA: tripartite tricarboxylate transporter substrate binding protein [Burkholderiales bacterium]|nr:tripartite tricarboxylate transporter substrate binding protein [Burkholderiales bacterium]